MFEFLHVRMSLAQPLDPLVQWKLMNVVMRAKFDAKITPGSHANA